jgi:hypothetical protein
MRKQLKKKYGVCITEEVPYIVRVWATSVADAKKRAEEAFYDLRLVIPNDEQYPGLKTNDITDEDMEQWGDVSVKVHGTFNE